MDLSYSIPRIEIKGWSQADAEQAWLEGWCLCVNEGEVIIAGNDCGFFSLDCHAHRYVTHRAIGPYAPDLYRRAVAILQVTRGQNRLECADFCGESR